MGMSETAIENDKRLGLPLIEVKKVFADPNFNCRGTFGAQDVIELARDVAMRGLVEPVIVRKMWEDREKDLIAKGYEYSLIAGFRRHYAYRVNDAEKIPCVIREINSDFDCRDINAVENLQRTDLNLYQEAKSIRHYWVAGWTREQIAKRISKSPGWVQLRIMLLEMPEEIQTAAGQGYYMQDDLRLLYSKRKDLSEMLRLAGIIRDRRKAGQKRDVLAHVKQKPKPLSKKIRKPSEIFDIMDILREICVRADPELTIKVEDIISSEGNSIATRLLAWATGEATNLEAHRALQKLANVLGTVYELPEFDTVN